MTLSNIVWAKQVSAASPLPDQRMKSRLASIIVDAMDSPSASIPIRANLRNMALRFRAYAPIQRV
jgi:hypothetical protein